MKRTAEYRELPHTMPLDPAPQATIPTPVEGLQAWVGYAGLCAGTVGMLALAMTYSLWALLAVVAGCLMTGWGLWGNGWLRCECDPPLCDDCGQPMYDAGDVWVCETCSGTIEM